MRVRETVSNQTGDQRPLGSNSRSQGYDDASIDDYNSYDGRASPPTASGGAGPAWGSDPYGGPRYAQTSVSTTSVGGYPGYPAQPFHPPPAGADLPPPPTGAGRAGRDHVSSTTSLTDLPTLDRGLEVKGSSCTPTPAPLSSRIVTL